ncbi:unnamed protein product, partial [Hapterophycus canaliculatus]
MPSVNSHGIESQLTEQTDDGQVYSMRLEPCAGLEVSLAQNWSAIGPTSAEVRVTFRGVSPSPGESAV